LHEQRFASRKDAVPQGRAIADLPDGAMVAIDGVPHARGDRAGPGETAIAELSPCL